LVEINRCGRSIFIGLERRSDTKAAGVSFRSRLLSILVIARRRKMANPFVHVELNTTDISKAKDFYSKLFDWKLEDVPDMAYTMIKVGEGTGGGMMKHPVPGAPSSWLAYVMVDDVNASTAKAKGLGATILKDTTEIPGVGWFSIFTDPTGATLALFKPKM
jgi:predicted enzyme related to lactoylglutathione lyase